MGKPKATVLDQWIGYCGGTSVEKRNGVPTEILHDEIWAICYTSEAHVVVRHGSARSKPIRNTKGAAPHKPFKPFVATPENPVPLKELTDRVDSLAQAERVFHERVEEKTSPKRKGHQFHAISFEQPPYYIESFTRYLNQEQGEASSLVPMNLQNHLEFLREQYSESPCDQCGLHHPTIDLGDGMILEVKPLLDALVNGEEGQNWLTASILLQGDTMIEVQTGKFLGRIITSATCPAPSHHDRANEHHKPIKIEHDVYA